MRKRIFVEFVAITCVVLCSFTAAVADEVTLRFSDWHLTEDHWRQSLQEAIAIFHRRNPSIHVVLEPVPYNQKEKKYMKESAAGKAPDVFHIHAFSLPLFFNKGYARDLTPFIKKEETNFLDPWYPLPLQLMRYNGKMHAMPGDFMTMVLFYNTEMFKAAGLDHRKPPQTWDELLGYARKLTRDTDGDGRIDQWGFGMVGAKNPGFSLRFSPLLWSFGADYLTPNLKHSALNTTSAKEAFSFFVKLYTQEGIIPPESIGMTPQQVRAQLAQKKVAMIFGSGWTPPIVDRINPDLNAFVTLRCAPVPIKRKPSTAIWLSSWVMSSSTEHPEEAWRLIKFLTSKEMELKWFIDNRVISSRKDVSENAEAIRNDKFASVLASQIPYGKVEPQINQWTEIIDMVAEALQEAITGKKTIDAALSAAHDRINKVLNGM